MPQSIPLRIFHGWDIRQAEAADVFAWSVLEHATVPVEIIPLKLNELPIRRAGVTAFSYARFLVPWHADFEGRAVFFDGCDQLCLGDVAELGVIPLRGMALRVVKHGGRPRGWQQRPRSWSSVMLLDCARFGEYTPHYVETARDAELMRFAMFSEEEIGELPGEWNRMIEPPHTEPPEDAKLGHWSWLSRPDGGSWIERSRSYVWAQARDRWRKANARQRAV